MKLKSLLFMLLAMLTSATLHAQMPHYYGTKIGDMYYNIIGNDEVEVTFKEGEENIIINDPMHEYDPFVDVPFIIADNVYSGNVVIPDSVILEGNTYRVTGISDMAFAECRRLTSVTIPNSITRIGQRVFENCERLTSITIGTGLSSIGFLPFIGANKLSSIKVLDGNPNYNSRDNCNALIETSTNTLLYGCNKSFIPEGVTSIGDFAFSASCPSLTSVSIPESVTSIGDYAFSGCTGLTSITIPESVTSIGDYAFSGCTGLTSITIPESVTSIGVRTFYACSSLTSVTIPEGVTSIGDYAFFCCTGLTSITIPESVTSIGDNAFYNCTGLTSVTIPEGVTSIGDNAFSSCTGLTSITIPDGVTDIGVYVFYGCTGLTSVTIPNSLTSINDGVFSGCTGLTSVTIPDGVTDIGGDAFYNCTGLTSVTIPDGVTDIGRAAFSSCTGLTSVTIPNSLTSINDGVFSGCTGLTSVTIPDGVTDIGGYAFFRCFRLTSITIPESVTYINSNAFAECTGLKNIYCYAEDVPEAPAAFGYNNSYVMIVNHAKLHVPATSIEAYKTTEPWSDFKSIVSIAFYRLTFIVDGEEYKSYQLVDGETIIPEIEPTKEGYTFSGWSEIPETMPTNDVVVNGTFFVNTHTLTYLVDGEVYKTDSISYGTTLIPEEELTKDGYTFSGWSEIPETMPDHDVTVTGTFTINPCTIVFDTDGGSPIQSLSGEAGNTITPPEDPTREGYTFLGWEPAFPETIPQEGLVVKAIWQINSYALVYIVDGEEYKKDTLEYNTPINPEEDPIKEGYTFSGWSEIPEVMPAHDFVITGTFTANSYTIIYMVDGEEYKTSTVVYGSEIIPEEEPTKEGYTFSGWNEVPETMPAGDVVVTGSFTVNSYTLSYMVDGEEYKTSSVVYGSAIIPEAEPTKEGYTFSGWSEIPEMMPAEDVTVTGSFTINQYLLTYILEGEEYMSYEVDYNTVLTPEEVPVKKGMTFSGWNEMPETMPAHDVTLTGSYNWSKETLGGIVYEVADTLSNYASVIGYEGESEEAELLSEVVIGGDSYTVYSIAKDALPKMLTIHISVGRLLLWLWSNDYTDIKETETGRDLSAPEVALVAKSASSLTLSFVNDYPEFSETVEVSGSSIEKGENGYSIKLTGLDPDYEYEGLASVTLTFEDASYTRISSFRTDPLNLTTLEPKVISEGNVIVAAESNLDDEEANVGFKWRRTAWEDDEEIFPSRSGVAYLYEGMMEGIIRNISSNPWKVRPFYTSNTGNTYYGNWRGIDPSDYSYFEPTIHTYAALAVTDSTAEVKGYAMQGTDDVESQGFMYWENTPSPSSSRRKANGIPDEVKIVEVFSPMMKVTLNGLDYDTEYCFVAFIKTANGETFYGEQQSFRTTCDPDGIEEIEDSTLKIEEAWYSLDGKKLAKPQKGINIIRYSDGTTRKVLIK